MEYIDLENWERRDYFKMYLGTDLPYIIVTADLDVTNLLAYAKKRDLSSYLTMIHVAHRTAQSITNFRYRVKDGQPIVNHRMRVSFTHVPDGTEIFVNVTMEFDDDLMAFHEKAHAQIATQGNDLGLEALRGRYDFISYSALPWIRYTHFLRTIARAGVDSNPKISWGKYSQEAGRMVVPFSVQVHHGLMDGLHVGRYYEEMQRLVDGL